MGEWHAGGQRDRPAPPQLEASATQRAQAAEAPRRSATPACAAGLGRRRAHDVGDQIGVVGAELARVAEQRLRPWRRRRRRCRPRCRARACPTGAACRPGAAARRPGSRAGSPPPARRVERRPADDPVVVVVDVAVAEEHRGRVGARPRRRGARRGCSATSRLAELDVVLELAVGIAERARAPARPSTVAAASPPRPRAASASGVGSASTSAVPLSPCVHDHRWTSAPAAAHAASVPPHDDLGVVGVGVDGEATLGRTDRSSSGITPTLTERSAAMRAVDRRRRRRRGG